jgi:hypothetical protein
VEVGFPKMGGRAPEGRLSPTPRQQSTRTLKFSAVKIVYVPVGTYVAILIRRHSSLDAIRDTLLLFSLFHDGVLSAAGVCGSSGVVSSYSIDDDDTTTLVITSFLRDSHNMDFHKRSHACNDCWGSLPRCSLHYFW